MNVHTTNNYPYSFSGRCIQIRDAQWVCHAISACLPHISTTRNNVMYHEILDNKSTGCQIIKKLTVWRHKLIGNLNTAREDYQCGWHDPYNVARSIILQLQEQKLGNCSENADMAEIILKMNGIKNARTAGLKAGSKEVDHKICVFNIDGSPVGKQIGENTVIIDPWLGLADFASNVFLKYRNMFRSYLKISEQDKLKIVDLGQLKLISQDIQDLRKEFPQFIFKSKTRNFMQSTKT